LVGRRQTFSYCLMFTTLAFLEWVVFGDSMVLLRTQSWIVSSLFPTFLIFSQTGSWIVFLGIRV